MDCLHFLHIMWKEIITDNDIGLIVSLFNDGAALVSVSYDACGENSCKNDVRTAVLCFSADKPFRLKFVGVNCLHIVPITTGSIAVKEVAAGRFGKLFFWADDAYFNVTEPDTSLTYAIAEKIFLER